MIERFHAHFSHIEDPRIDRRRLHLINDIFFLSVCAVLAGADGFTEIEEFGHQRIEWLRKYIALAEGIPSHDTIGRLFAMVTPDAFQEAFTAWIEDLLGEDSNTSAVATDIDASAASQAQHIAIDGKSIRGNGRGGGLVEALKIVSAWSSNQQLTLGQKLVDKGSNEIPVIPLLLAALELKGSIVSIDAMGCQTDIAEVITTSEADYVLAVKGNQPSLLRAVEEAFDQLHEQEVLAEDGIEYHTHERGHSRSEHRYYYLINPPELIGSLAENWAGVRSIGQSISIVERDGVETSQVRYYISSLEGDVDTFARCVRDHWQIENTLHWVLDVVFAEDQSRIHGRNAAANFAFIRKFCLSLLKREPSKGSMKAKRKRAGWNIAFLESVLFLKI